MKITPEETELRGDFVLNNKKIEFDEVNKRIKELISDYLVRIAIYKDGWDSLYQDPEDKRFWELIFWRSEMQGGGPMLLHVLSEEEARQKYQF